MQTTRLRLQCAEPPSSAAGPVAAGVMLMPSISSRPWGSTDPGGKLGGRAATLSIATRLLDRSRNIQEIYIRRFCRLCRDGSFFVRALRLACPWPPGQLRHFTGEGVALETRGSPGTKYPGEQQRFTGVFATFGATRGERPVQSFGHFSEFFPLLGEPSPLPWVCR